MNADRPGEILLDDARPGQERLRRFTAPSTIIRADEVGEVDMALTTLERARNDGCFVAGYFSYELGYALEPRLQKLMPADRKVPLLWFGVFDACEEFTGSSVRALLEAHVRGRAYGGPLVHEWSAGNYDRRFARTHELIEAGDIYQANLSFRSRFAAVGDPMALYLKLREHSSAAHGAFIDDGERYVLSLSPELFFSISRDGEIAARPMKGTAARGTDPASDVATRAALQASEKDRAENLMIVDLLRNDLGRVAEIGSVSAEELFKVETYPTLHTMVSTVRAKLRPQTGIPRIVQALFPCGSVTGTPKIRAMEIIREREQSPRGVYCGAIGYFAPDGSAAFNVAIRTLTLKSGHGELGIGGAVVHDSRSGAEYDECLLKARYYDSARRPIELIETLHYSPSAGFVRLPLHLTRMANSAVTFVIPFDPDAALQAMEAAVEGTSVDLRVRLLLAESGAIACTVAPLPVTPDLWIYRISDVTLQSGDILLQHKTSWREIYEAEAARTRNCDEVIFLNDRGELAEGSRTNVFIRQKGKLLTPPLASGILDGCLRRELIETGECQEQAIYPRDLETADEVFLGNSLRGLVKAVPA